MIHQEPTEAFWALGSEALFTKEILGSGVNQIQRANYSKQGAYFQAFTSLSTGLERLGKICLILDFYVEQAGTFPGYKFFSKEICHDIEKIYDLTKQLVNKHCLQMKFQQNLDSEIYQDILSVLTNFAIGDRYRNINLVIGRSTKTDPVAEWCLNVDRYIIDNMLPKRKKPDIQEEVVMRRYPESRSLVYYYAETGEVLTRLYDATVYAEVQRDIAPYRKLLVLQIIRYWADIATQIADRAVRLGKGDIPDINRIFAYYRNSDRILKSKRDWERD